MKISGAFVVACFMALAGGCSAISVQYDYDTAADFSKLKTYDWLPTPEDREISQLSVRRIKNAVNTELGAKGLALNPNNPDFLIAMHIMKRRKLDIRNWGYGYGHHWGRYGGGHRIDVYQYEEGTLILDFVEVESLELIWRGVARGRIESVATPEKRRLRINRTVRETLKNFPPPPAR